METDDDDKEKKRPKPLPMPVRLFMKGMGEFGRIQMCDAVNRSACDGTTPGVGSRPSRQRTDDIVRAIEIGEFIGKAGRVSGDDERN